MDIEITEDVIRSVCRSTPMSSRRRRGEDADADGAVRVDGEIETRRGRQAGIGSRVVIDLPQGRRELRVVHPGTDSKR